MRTCPQCNSAFDDSQVFCTEDGVRLIEEDFVLPSEVTAREAEQETVIRHEPLNINIPQQPATQFGFQTQPPPSPPQYQPPKKQRNFFKYFMFLFLGILLGAGLVLALIAAGLYLYQRAITTNPDTVRSTPTPPGTSPKLTVTPSPSSKHLVRTSANDDDFNGIVIATNGRVRTLPNKTAPQTDVLPKNDRLDIIERAAEKSVWYRITCEHGTTGWIHGNEIKYTR